MTITQQTNRKPPRIPSAMRNLFLNVSVDGDGDDGGGDEEGGDSTSIGAIGLSIIINYLFC